MHTGLPLADPDVLDPAGPHGGPQELFVHLQRRSRLSQGKARAALEGAGEALGNRQGSRTTFSHGGSPYG